MSKQLTPRALEKPPTLLQQIKPNPCFVCLQRLLKAKGAKKQAREQPLVSPGDTHALCDQEAVSIVSQISQDSPNTQGFLETKGLLKQEPDTLT